jgi:hypothetical protein
MLEECPKCKRAGLEPIYHRKDDSKCITGTFINIVDWEHLHYRCKCGYDFVKEIREGED